jgi:8-oxo-dGTP pyrophosphatase MutT (NUDIX family)
MLDRFYRLAYNGAYQMMRVYWAVRRPDTHGALVAIWHDGKILLVRNSYLKYYSLPGGYVRTGETGRQAAMRELLEEVGIGLTEDKFVPALDARLDWEGKRDHVEIFRVDLPYAPKIVIDNREVVAAQLYTPQEALKLDLFPPLRQHIEAELAKKSS